jgi:ergothioneine biosynthesis protein EgtB
VEDVYAYRKYVDAAMERLLSCQADDVLRDTLLLGLNHEQQHQELLWTDIKFILGHNPLFPALSEKDIDEAAAEAGDGFVSLPAGIYEIGFEGEGFCFDNERARHKVYLNDYEISSSLVTNSEYLGFIKAGGYENFSYWHAEGWDWVKNNQVKGPLYWHFIDGKWYNYTLAGLRPVDPKAPVCHISYYEAVAYAAWKGMRLPTEWEWEASSGKFNWGKRWEWTESAYLPYPGFKKAEGAIGEYNGKFMVSQMVLRGASVATPAHHSRNTYRNFFHPHLRWQFTGIRLAR